MKRRSFIGLVVATPLVAVVAKALPPQRIIRRDDPEAEWFRLTAPLIERHGFVTHVGMASEANLSTEEITVDGDTFPFNSVAFVFDTPKWVKDKYPNVRVMPQGEKMPVGVALYKIGMVKTRTLSWGCPERKRDPRKYTYAKFEDFDEVKIA